MCPVAALSGDINSIPPTCGYSLFTFEDNTFVFSVSLITHSVACLWSEVLWDCVKIVKWLQWQRGENYTCALFTTSDTVHCHRASTFTSPLYRCPKAGHLTHVFQWGCRLWLDWGTPRCQCVLLCGFEAEVLLNEGPESFSWIKEHFADWKTLLSF